MFKSFHPEIKIKIKGYIMEVIWITISIVTILGLLSMIASIKSWPRAGDLFCTFIMSIIIIAMFVIMYISTRPYQHLPHKRTTLISSILKFNKSLQKAQFERTNGNNRISKEILKLKPIKIFIK